MPIGYCTNVHAGADLATTRANLERYAVEIKNRLSPTSPMGIGLWLSATTSLELEQPAVLAEFAEWLDQTGLVPFTLNGFPYGDFHEAVVKHRVYEPTWAENARVEYTIRLAKLLDQLLPTGQRGSISTLPLGWRTCGQDPSFAERCAKGLQRVADALADLQETRGREIVLSLEPEPGCAFDTADGAAHFFDRYLPNDGSQKAIRLRRHIGVCHDICHSAVMRESQQYAFDTYQARGLRVGKVQVSSAIRLLMTEDSATNARAVEYLQGFAEDRYLHQTTVAESDGSVSFHEDLPEALRSTPPVAGQEWRIHFHVPIHESRLGLISSTHDEIPSCLDAIATTQTPVDHFEVETYAWNVLPAEHRVQGITEGIAAELSYFQRLIAEHGRVSY
ncbi:MAG: metabolite traffic protein EboE [Planctomycetales bacterium]|nr:metabolite traffic protein EboE [Planctomycetales bacterium]